MTKKKLYKILIILILMLISTTFVSAIQNFSVNPISFNLNSSLNLVNSNKIIITNIGNETLNLTISKINLKNNSNIINLILNETSILNLNKTKTNSFNFTFNSGNILNDYNGKIVISNNNNLSQNISIPIFLQLNSSNSINNQNNNSLNSSLEIIGETNLISLNSDLGNTERINFRFKNNGLNNLTNIRIRKFDLTGSSTIDKIRNYNYNFNQNNFNLNKNEVKNVELRINIPTDISVDTYLGSFTLTADNGYSKSWNFKVIISGSNIDIQIFKNSLNVRNGLLTEVGDKGSSIRNYRFTINNRGNIDANNLNFQIASQNLIEENSGKTLPSSAITFIPNTLNLRRGNTKEVEVRVNIPSNQAVGNYFADINILSKTGTIYDKIRLKVKVLGDIYIKSITSNNNIKPGNDLNLELIVKNKGFQLQRNIKIETILQNIDNSNSDLTRTSNSFLLDINQENTQKFKIPIPKDATDGSHALSIRVSFNNQDFTIIKDINIKRDNLNIEINTHLVNPKIVSCDRKINSFLKIQNLGKFDEQVQVSSEILGTPLKIISNKFNLNVNEIKQKTQTINGKLLNSGNYNLIQKVIYRNNLFKKITVPIQILNCSKNNLVQVKINNSVNQVLNNSKIINKDKMKIFGNYVEKTTIYLTSGLILVIILIIVSLFLL